MGADELVETERRRWFFRHPLAIRVAHWLNAACLLVLLMSGLQIFNAHPALYWGEASTFDRPLLSIGASEDDTPRGITTVFGRRFDTTGWLGVSASGQGEQVERAFPDWTTLPADQDLATGRRWHFLFAWVLVANGAVYVAYGIATGQLWRRTVPTREQWRHVGRSVLDHLSLRFPRGEEAKVYNAIQKLTYLVLILVLLPLQILAGLAMSPAIGSVAPVLLDVLGGRQSARTIHFVIANLLVLFVLVHVAMVVLSGLANNLRAMVTGWFVLESRSRVATTRTPDRE